MERKRRVHVGTGILDHGPRLLGLPCHVLPAATSFFPCMIYTKSTRRCACRVCRTRTFRFPCAHWTGLKGVQSTESNYTWASANRTNRPVIPAHIKTDRVSQV